jgi:hypothetical protein
VVSKSGYTGGVVILVVSTSFISFIVGEPSCSPNKVGRGMGTISTHPLSMSFNRQISPNVRIDVYPDVARPSVFRGGYCLRGSIPARHILFR